MYIINLIYQNYIKDNNIVKFFSIDEVVSLHQIEISFRFSSFLTYMCIRR